MLPKGKQEIAEFAGFVKGNEQIDRIEVRGYTDPEAPDAYNQALLTTPCGHRSWRISTSGCFLANFCKRLR